MWSGAKRGYQPLATLTATGSPGTSTCRRSATGLGAIYRVIEASAHGFLGDLIASSLRGENEVASHYLGSLLLSEVAYSWVYAGYGSGNTQLDPVVLDWELGMGLLVTLSSANWGIASDLIGYQWDVVNPWVSNWSDALLTSMSVQPLLRGADTERLRIG